MTAKPARRMSALPPAINPALAAARFAKIAATNGPAEARRIIRLQAFSHYSNNGTAELANRSADYFTKTVEMMHKVA